MLFLLGSIFLTSYLTLAFKVVQKYRISNLQTIVFNHIVCVIVGSIVNGRFPITANTFEQSWFPWACVMGFMFISLFNLVATTAQKIGVAVTSVANKLSLVIPFIFSIYLYNERTTALKVAGIVLALFAVLLTCWPGKANNKTREKEGKTTFNALIIILPAVLFLGSGLLDTMIKYVEQAFLNEHNKNAYLITAFASAAVIGTILILFLVITKQQKFDYRSILSGICIGVPNYFSIWCLLKVLADYAGNSSAIIPINNMGIVLFSTLVAWLLFKERLSIVNWIGVLLSLGAISLIAYG